MHWKQSKQLFGLIATLALVGWLSDRVDPSDYAGGRSRDAEQRMIRNASSIAHLFGEFRTSISDMLFVKTERYLHGGILYQAHLADEILTVEGMAREIDHHQEEHEEELQEQAATEHHHGHHHHHHGGHHHHHQDDPEVPYVLDHSHAGTPTIIPTPQKDFRGYVGWLHRQVKPWRAPELAHRHTDGTQLLPWFKLMTVSDRHYIQGYTIGGFWLKHRNPDAALEFVEQGLVHNPESFQLHLSRGYLLIDRARALRRETPDSEDHIEADALMRQARRDFAKAAQFASKVRPTNFEGDIIDALNWSTYMENDALASFNMHVLTESRHGRHERAIELANHYLSIIPDNAALHQFLNRQ